MLKYLMHVNDFDYNLPPELIAQTPSNPRDHSRLLVYNRLDHTPKTAHFYDILDYLKKGDVVVINTTRVMQARLKVNGKEVLLIKRISDTKYEVIGKGIKGTQIMEFTPEQLATAETPLPHYIHIPLTPEISARYDTVYADQQGSAAAPTAGLHWTPELMERAKAKGITFCEILLHVGLGTFRPVKCDNIEDHQMHAEYYEVTTGAAKIINDAKRENRRVIACGTTSVRTLESV
ncbi:MAG: S-adenosylmethionine:tRNA ribosyltransferase-isomerase, partial [Christensenellaceae bacterium]|nr:S-adenosylmethionine:tRNA ribosyltransferase-isomerase [Christensenellaceae bacterium]